MAVISQRDISESRDSAGRPATASDLAFARPKANRHFWKRARALIRRAYGPLIVHAILNAALIATVALKVATWLPTYWR